MTLLVAFFALSASVAMAAQSSAQPTEGGGAAAQQTAEASTSKPHLVSGVVLDENGKPMAGVGVIIPTTLQGVVTDIDGKYQIKATPEQSIEFSFLGYKSEVVKVGSRTNIDISLKTEAQAVQSVVVTALGIKRDEKSLGYAAQKNASKKLYNMTQHSLRQNSILLRFMKATIETKLKNY